MNTAVPKDEPLKTEAILHAFATAERKLPRTALEQAVERWPEVAPELLRMLQAEADGAEPSDETTAILFFGIYLMAQVHETRAFAPLCAVASNGERMSELIGDGLTEDLQAILARVYDGDPAPLRRLIEAENADEFARSAGFDALAWLTATGRIGRIAAEAYLRDLHSTLLPRHESFAWVGWQRAIARLGLDVLAPLVEDAFNRSWIDPSIMAVEGFRQDLAAARRAVLPTDPFDWDGSRLDNIVTHMSTWYAFNQQETQRSPLDAPRRLTDDQPYHNPYRGVGRNDPCPCGSGKKFKNCCLGKVS